MQYSKENKQRSKTSRWDSAECDNCAGIFTHLGYAMTGDSEANLYFCSTNCASSAEENKRHDMDNEESYHFYEQSLIA